MIQGSGLLVTDERPCRGLVDCWCIGLGVLLLRGPGVGIPGLTIAPAGAWWIVGVMEFGVLLVRDPGVGTPGY